MVKVEEIELPIKVNKFRAYVLGLMDRYVASPEAKELLRLKKGIAQIIIDEMLPLSILTEYGGIDENLLVKMYPRRNKSYDAEIISVRHELIERFEITMAIEGHRESIRMEHLVRYGRAPAYGNVKYKGNKKWRSIAETSPEAVTVLEENNKILSLIVSALRNKANKGEVYNNTSLLIGIECVTKLSNEFWAELKTIFGKENHPFNCVYVADIGIRSFGCSKFMA